MADDIDRKGIMVIAFIGTLACFAVSSCSKNKQNEISSVKETDEEEYSICYCEDEVDGNENNRCLYNQTVCVSEDRQVTIVSGMCPYGGTSPDYWSRWVYLNANGEQFERYVEEGAGYLDIHAIKRTDGITYYVVHCFTKSCSTDGYEWLEAYRIVGDSLCEVSVVNGIDEADLFRFSIYYNHYDWGATNDENGNSWVFKYDTDMRVLYVPLSDGAGRLVTDSCKVWIFNGERFENKGMVPIKTNEYGYPCASYSL